MSRAAGRLTPINLSSITSPASKKDSPPSIPPSRLKVPRKFLPSNVTAYGIESTLRNQFIQTCVGFTVSSRITCSCSYHTARNLSRAIINHDNKYITGYLWDFGGTRNGSDFSARFNVHRPPDAPAGEAKVDKVTFREYPHARNPTPAPESIHPSGATFLCFTFTCRP